MERVNSTYHENVIEELKVLRVKYYKIERANIALLAKNRAMWDKPIKKENAELRRTITSLAKEVRELNLSVLILRKKFRSVARLHIGTKAHYRRLNRRIQSSYTELMNGYNLLGSKNYGLKQSIKELIKFKQEVNE